MTKEDKDGGRCCGVIYFSYVNLVSPQFGKRNKKVWMTKKEIYIERDTRLCVTWQNLQSAENPS